MVWIIIAAAIVLIYVFAAINLKLGYSRLF
jgi:hypothetical protein